MQQTDIAVLERTLNYSFKNKNILREALTHSSYANELRAKKKTAVCNERLEFLGDAVLSSIVSEYLYIKYPDLPEGELTQRKAYMKDLEHRITENLGRRAKITSTPRKKVLELAYHDDEDLETLLKAICGAEFFAE